MNSIWQVNLPARWSSPGVTSNVTVQKTKKKNQNKTKTKKSEVLAKQQLLLTAEWYAVETKADVFLQLFHSMTSVDSDASYFLTLLQQDRSPDHNPLMPRPFPIFLSLLILLSVNN